MVAVLIGGSVISVFVPVAVALVVVGATVDVGPVLSRPCWCCRVETLLATVDGGGFAVSVLLLP